MHIKDALVNVLEWLRNALRGTGYGHDTWGGVLVIVLLGLVGLVAHVWFHHLVIWAHATLLVVAVLLAAIGYSEPNRDAGRKPAPGPRAKAVDDQLAKLVWNPNVGHAPYMFAMAIELYQDLVNSELVAGTRPERQKRAEAALKAFLPHVQALKTVGMLSTPVADRIFSRGPGNAVTHRAVWAVCGRKDEPTARKLYGACAASFGAGSHIERVFFPPDTAHDERDILNAIDAHLKVGMTVRAFRDRQAALAALYEFHLPRGFGMTWIGTCDRDPEDGLAVRSPDNDCDPTASVFVHWGGVGGADHKGVFLEGNADWAKRLCKLCKDVHGKAKVANADSEDETVAKIIPMTLDEFLVKFPDYRVSSRSDK